MAVLIACAGCAPDESAAWHADASFTRPERVAIAEGDLWLARHTGTEPKLIVWDLQPSDDHGAHTIEKGPLDNGANARTLGYGEDARVIIDTAMYGDSAYKFMSLRHDAAHELGHAMGLEHVKDETSLMYADSSPWMSWSSEDETECKRVGGCK